MRTRMVQQWTCLMLITALLLLGVGNRAFAWEETGGLAEGKRLFYTGAIPETVNRYLEESAETLAESMTVSLGLSEATIEFGNVISVIGSNNLYYVPVFIGQKSVYLLSLMTEGSVISAGYGEWECDTPDSLTEGMYYFYSDENGVYLIGEQESQIVYRIGQSENLPVYNPQLLVNYAAVDVNGRVIHKTITNSATKSVVSKELSSVPAVGNIKNTCWAACAASICQYYGNSAVTGDFAHTYAHGTTHTRWTCPGASLTVSYSVVHNLTGKTGVYNNSTRINAANVMASINQNKPVMTGWQPVSGSGIGHEMIFTGYQFNNTTGAFTYIIMDPNQSTRVYLTGTYSGTTPYYNGREWRSAYYDWN